MARMIYNMLQSVDGYIAGPEGGPQMPMFGGRSIAGSTGR